MKKISIVTICYNEVQNIAEFHRRCKKIMEKYSGCDYEIVVADNGSTDGTRDELRRIAKADAKFKVVLNSGNFGPTRSGTNAFLAATGDAVILLCSDLQEPPEMIPELIQKWEEGYKVVCAIKTKSKTNFLVNLLRKIYYRILNGVSETALINDFTGFGLYDRCFVEAFRKYHDPYPYFRGLVTEIGFKRCEISYTQEERKNGRSSYNLARYYDYAMTGFVNHTKLPLRMAVFCGFVLAALSLTAGFGYLIYKLLYWNTFQAGLAPLVIGLFFFSAVQLIFIGIIGEYIGAIWTQVKNKPLVVEEERINFDE